MEPPRENSPSTPSRYLNSYLQQNPTELFHPQNFPQRQLSNQQFYAAAAATADNLSTNNKNYLKRHHSNYDKNDSERDKKYDKKMVEEQAIHQTQTTSYDGFSNDAYSAASISTSTGSSTVAATPQQPKSGANNNNSKPILSNGKKTKGRVKIKMEYIDNKLRRYTTFSKRKTGIMKKAYELSTLTGTQVMLLVASETGHVYTFATRKLQPMITSEAGKTLIQTCLNSPDIPIATADQRMSATGFEETELNYSVSDIGENPGDKEKLPFQDDITSTDDSESENDENFLMPQNNHKLMQSQSPHPVAAAAQRLIMEEETKQLLHQQQLHHQQQQQQHQQQNMQNNTQRISEKILDNQKLLLESLSSLPQNLLQSWIQSGQLKVTVDDDGMQSITIPFAIQKENSDQEIITRKIPINLLMAQKVKSEIE